MVEDICSKCRICLLDNNKTYPLFDDENSLKYSDLIKEYTGFELDQKDNLPALICDLCLSELMVVIKFISKVRISCNKFRGFQNCLDPFSKNDSSSVKDEEDEDLPLSFISAASFNVVKGEQQNKFLEDIKQEDIEYPDDEVSLETFPCEAYKVFCPNYENDNSASKNNIFKSVTLNPTFSDGIKNKRLKKSQIRHRRIAKYIKNNGHTRLKFIKTATDKAESETKPVKRKAKVKFVILKSKEHGLKKDMMKCLVCGVLVQNKSASVVHMRKHTGEQPYHCTLCTKRFTQSGTLNTHMKKSHPKEWTDMLTTLKKEKKSKSAEKTKLLRLGEKWKEASSAITAEKISKEKELWLFIYAHTQMKNRMHVLTALDVSRRLRR